jgi:hypothetical protein
VEVADCVVLFTPEEDGAELVDEVEPMELDIDD